MITVSSQLLASLRSRPVIHQGHESDCVIDTSGWPGTPVRVWISRVGLADDAAGFNQVEVEVCRGGKWIFPEGEKEERALLRDALMDVNIDSRDAW